MRLLLTIVTKTQTPTRTELIKKPPAIVLASSLPIIEKDEITNNNAIAPRMILALYDLSRFFIIFTPALFAVLICQYSFDYIQLHLFIV